MVNLFLKSLNSFVHSTRDLVSIYMATILDSNFTSKKNI